MNRAQKNAWFGLVNCLLAMLFFVFMFLDRVYYVPVAGFKSAIPPSRIEIIFNAITQFWPFMLPVIAIILLLFPRQKQNPVEPDFDELDQVIRNKAIRVSFISVWLLWPLTLLIIMLKTGIPGTLSALECFFIHLWVFICCMIVYFAATVFLYRKQTNV